jgi:hypothetical protein
MGMSMQQRLFPPNKFFFIGGSSSGNGLRALALRLQQG